MIDKLIDDHIETITVTRQQCMGEIECFGALCREKLQNGGTIFFMGNGGSAADAQHLAAEFVGRFKAERTGLPAVALTTDTSILTAVGNDYGFEQIFARQVQALVKNGDLVVGLSTSGNSPNVVKAIHEAKRKGAATVGLTGQGGGEMAAICDVCIKVPSNSTARIQETHILIGHIVCALNDGDLCCG